MRKCSTPSLLLHKTPQVTEADIASIVAQWTGIPIEKVSSDETERLIKVSDHPTPLCTQHGCLMQHGWLVKLMGS